MANSPITPEVILRQAALAAGLTQFFTGTPCKRDHVSARNVASGACLACMRLADKARDPLRKPEYFQNNKKSMTEKNKAWQKANKEKCSEYSKKWAAGNKEMIDATGRVWRIANKVRVKANQKAWRDAHPNYDKQWREANWEKVVATWHRRRALVRNAEGFFTEDDIKRIFRQQKAKCAICRCCLKGGYTIEHIVALAKGGTNWPRNLQLACMPCNRSKGTKDQINFMRERGMLL